MAQVFYVIDGYNLMHAVGLAKHRYRQHELQRLRQQFLNFLISHLSQNERQHTLIVFDAIEAPKGLSRYQRMAGLEILFAKPGHDADTLIEQILTHHSAPRQVQVISSDHRLQRAARHRRATSCDSEEFFTSLERRGQIADGEKPKRPAEPPGKFGHTLSESELDQWADYFETLAEAEELVQESKTLRKQTARKQSSQKKAARKPTPQKSPARKSAPQKKQSSRNSETLPQKSTPASPKKKTTRKAPKPKAESMSSPTVSDRKSRAKDVPDLSETDAFDREILLSPEELNLWLAEFGNIPEAEKIYRRDP